jgi:hypothetical protein
MRRNYIAPRSLKRVNDFGSIKNYPAGAAEAPF